MPTLARFYGIVIRIYFLGSEHNPPHVHATYSENEASFDISTGRIIDGTMSSRVAEMVKEWIALNRVELLDMWETQEFKKLGPFE
jgi:hypothetical protein